MLSLPGLPPEAITQILVYGVGVIAFVSALARVLREVFLDARLRLANEGSVIGMLSAPVVLLSGLACYFYVLSIATLLMESHPDVIPNMAASWTALVLAVTDPLLGLNAESTPRCLSWLAAAVALHFAAELLRWLLGAPQRRRERQTYNAAVEAIGRPPAKVPEPKSILKKGY